MRAFKQRQVTEYVKILTIVQAIGFAGNTIAAAVAQGDPPGPDAVNDLLSQLKGLLLPELAEERDQKAKKVMELLKKEQETGPFKVEAMTYKKKGKGLN